MTVDSDALAGLVGGPVTDEAARGAFASLAVPWEPHVDPSTQKGWLVIGNIELGFEGFASFHALEVDQPDPLVVEQVCFYAPRDATGEVMPPPRALEYGMRRDEARERLARDASAGRLGRRDAYEFPEHTVVLAYDAVDALDSVLVLAWRGERLSVAEPPLGFAELAQYFGRPWHDSTLRQRLYVLADSPESLAQIKKHGTCDLIRRAGLQLLFKSVGDAWLLIGVEIYRSRVKEAAKWSGDLPFGIAFTDSVEIIAAKIGAAPSSQHAEDLQGRAVWSLGAVRVVVIFDLVVNLVASITYAGSDHWA